MLKCTSNLISMSLICHYQHDEVNNIYLCITMLPHVWKIQPLVVFVCLDL